MSIETAESYFAGQVSVLLEGGIDLLMFETFGEVAELEASVRAARRLSILPVVAQIAAGEDGLSFGGLAPTGQDRYRSFERGLVVFTLTRGIDDASTSSSSRAAPPSTSPSPRR